MATIATTVAATASLGILQPGDGEVVRARQAGGQAVPSSLER